MQPLPPQVHSDAPLPIPIWGVHSDHQISFRGRRHLLKPLAVLCTGFELGTLETR